MTEDEKTQGAWEVYLYARDLLAKRMSYGMIAQSMLLIAFSTLAAARTAGDAFTAYFQIMCALLGLVYTAYQYVRVVSIQGSIRKIEDDYFVGRDLVFSAYLDMARAKSISRNFSQQAVLILFFCGWAAFLVGAIALTPRAG